MPQVPVKRTVVDSKTYARAVQAACRELGWPPLSKAAVGVLWAQYMIETGGKACWGWNIGNVKASKAQVAADVEWHDLPGTWEIVNGKRVTLPEGDPGRRFLAFRSLDGAMLHHLQFLRNRRYASAWPSVEAGDCDGFARRLKAAGYYTASADDYARGMLAHWRKWMASGVFEATTPAEAETVPALPDDEGPPSEPTKPYIVHPKVEFPLRVYDLDDPDDAA